MVQCKYKQFKLAHAKSQKVDTVPKYLFSKKAFFFPLNSVFRIPKGQPTLPMVPFLPSLYFCSTEINLKRDHEERNGTTPKLLFHDFFYLLLKFSTYQVINGFIRRVPLPQQVILRFRHFLALIDTFLLHQKATLKWLHWEKVHGS